MFRRARWRLAWAVVATGLAACGDASGQTPTCFGAAARDPDRKCSNTALGHRVTPMPREARELPNSPCRPLVRRPSVCGFGARAGAATVALVGDSHAGHWRAALDHVAQSKGWRGLSITHSSCPLQKAVRDIPEPRRTSCARWKNEVFAWFERHPEVSVVFAAGLTGFTGVVPRPGRSRFETSVQSYVDAWRALPRSVSKIVVLRDTPKVRGSTDDCVTRAVAQRRAPGPACAVSRSFALERDPAMTAAARVGGPRVARVDLTRYFCDARCYPVVGGVLVLRDSHHMTGAFSGTLGPYLLRALPTGL